MIWDSQIDFLPTLGSLRLTKAITLQRGEDYQERANDEHNHWKPPRLNANRGLFHLIIASPLFSLHRLIDFLPGIG